MAVVNTGFDPLFGDPLRRLIERAKAEGYDASLISGVRDDEDQRQLVANAAATRAGQPLPYPNRGPVRKAAPVGYSAHEYGAASDVRGVPQAELSRLAPQLGLNTIPGDPGHVELANWRQVAANQAPPTPWADVPNVPSAYASNAAAPSAPASAAIAQAAPPPGVTINSAPDRLASMVGTLESGGGRYASAQSKSMVDPLYGQYPGFAKTYGRGAAGIDNYAQAVMAANPNASVGDFYAGYFSGTGKPGSPNFNNFDLLSKGAIQNTPGSPAAQMAAAANFTKNAGVDPSTPLAAVVGAHGIGSDAVAGGTAASEKAPPTWQDVAKAFTAPGEGGKASPLEALTKGLEGGDQKQQGGQQADQAKQQLQAEQAAAAYGQQRQQALAVQSQQLMAQILAQARKPLSWGSAPPGAGIGPSMGLGAGQIPRPAMGATDPSVADQQLAMLMQQDAPGTTLNSMGGPYG